MEINEEIDVLLATYNGEKYIEEFMQSLTKQKQVKINLFVSDDGSTDNTLRIVASFKGNFNSLQFYKVKNFGPAKNFLSMLEYSNANYIAFADQDDIWLENHLIKSIERIQKYTNEPCLSFTNVLEFGENRAKQIWPKKYPVNLNCFFENPARGCTQVFNKELGNLLRKVEPSYIIMHDWMAVLISKYCGKMQHTFKPEVFYRIHNNNAIGKGMPLHRKLLKLRHFRRMAKNKTFIQLNYFFNNFENYLNEEGKYAKNRFYKLQSSRNIVSRYFILKMLNRNRIGYIENLLFSTRLLFK